MHDQSQGALTSHGIHAAATRALGRDLVADAKLVLHRTLRLEVDEGPYGAWSLETRRSRRAITLGERGWRERTPWSLVRRGTEGAPELITPKKAGAAMSARFLLDTTHSSIDFSVRHLVIAKVRGRFTKFSGTVDLDGMDMTRSVVTAEIDASSINTNDDKRDAHLRSADFLDVERFPHLAFTSKHIERRGGHLLVTGALTIHGVTHDATFEVEQHGTTKDPWGNIRVAFSARGSIDRKDFGLVWNQALEAGGVLVGEKVEINLDIEGVKAAVEVAA